MDNTQTQTQISALRTLQESYDALASASSSGATSTALESAKLAILNAISALSIPTVAQILNGLAKTSELPDVSGLATASALSSVATDAASAASDAAAAKTAAQAITGYATETNATANKNAIIAEIQANAGVPTLTIPSTTASQELASNTLYVFAERTTDLTLTLGTPIVGIANEYHLFLIVGSTAPTITWPTGISWNGGSAPTIAADKTYEVSILNNVAAYFEIDNPEEESDSI